MTTTRVAAIDCGTNSIRLLVADVTRPDGGPDGGPDGETAVLVDVERRMEVGRLGEGVDRTGVLAPAALRRTLAATQRYAELVRHHGAERVRFVATSASRDARNAEELVTGVRRLLGVDPEVVSGAEEARLSFLGATAGLRGDAAGRDPHLVVDLGGGSTELVLGSAATGVVEAATSTDVGCVRLTERHLRSDPPGADELAAARADVARALDAAAAAVPLERAAVLVGVAGTVTTVTAHALRLASYDPQRLHGAALPVGAVLAACAELTAMTRAQRAALGPMHPGRVDVIGAGALVWGEVVARVAAASGVGEVVASEHDILDGMALVLARQHP